MPKSKFARQAFGKAGHKRYKKFSKIKKLVTGEGPTMLEKIASGVGGVASVAKAVLPAIAAINTEAKYFDQTAAVTSNTPGTNDAIIDLTGQIAPGTGDSDRIGNSVLGKDLQVRLAIQFTPTSTIEALHCRMMIICWKSSSIDNAVTAAKLFEAPTNLYSPVNKDYSDQMVVLKDKFFTLNANTTNLNPQGFVTMKIFKKIPWHLRWQDGGGSPTLNHLFLVLRSSSATVSMGTTYYSRFNYTDN